MANSDVRSIDRISRRFATFAIAMTKTSATAPKSSSRVVRTGATSASSSGTGDSANPDVRFLDQFPYFGAGATEGALRLTGGERRAFLRTFHAMAAEVRTLQPDTPDLIRARLYEMLVLLGRWYTARHATSAVTGAHAAIDRFHRLIEQHFPRRHRVSEYAADVGLTPGHLNALCRWHLGQSAGSLIRQRLVLEAKRMLRYGDMPAFVVARELGFRDPAYFTRFFRREAGTTPRHFRQERQRAAGAHRRR